MSIFISHVEENRDTAEAIARGLAAAGFAAWTYENSSVPGPTYLSQVMNAIEDASAVILVISPQALGSHQVAKEIEAAHELDRPIIPVLVGISHEKYLQRRPEWRLALGAFTSIELPREGVEAIMPKVVGGLEALGITHDEGGPSAPQPRADAGSPGPEHRAIWKRPWFVGVAAVVLTSLVAGVVVVVLSQGGREHPSEPRSTPTATNPTGSTGTPTDIPDVTQPLGELRATLRVRPVKAVSTDTLTMTYTLTNNSSYDFTGSGTTITILLGSSPGGTAIQLSDLSQDIAAGAEVTGTVYANLADAFARPGPQMVWISIGQRFSGGSVGDVYPARVPIVIER